MRSIKAVSVSILMIGMVAMLAGATLCYFDDAEASTGDTTTAGTLNLEYRLYDADAPPGVNIIFVPDTSWQDGTNARFVFGNISSGDSGHMTYEIKNSGSIDGYVDLNEVRGSGTSMNVTVWHDEDGDGIEEDGETVIYSGPIKDLKGNGQNFDVNILLNANGNTYISFSWIVTGSGKKKLKFNFELSQNEYGDYFKDVETSDWNEFKE
jgi:hypothetical protein